MPLRAGAKKGIVYSFEEAGKRGCTWNKEKKKGRDWNSKFFSSIGGFWYHILLSRELENLKRESAHEQKPKIHLDSPSSPVVVIIII